MRERDSQGERRVVRGIWRLGPALALIATGLLWSRAAGGATRYLNGEITVSAEPMPSHSGYGNSIHGYVEYRVSVTNRSSTKPHRVRLILPCNRYGRGCHRIAQITRTVLVGPNSTMTIPLHQPPLPLDGSRIGIYIDGRRQGTTVTCGDTGHGNDNNSYACVLASRNGSQALRKKAQGTHIDSKNVQLYRSETEVSQWSGNWLAYSRYDGLIVTGREMQQMPPRAMAAITQYIECGGSLLVTGGNWREPKTWRRHRLDTPGEPTYLMGFGRCCVLNGSGGRSSGPQWERVKQMWQQSYQPFSDRRDIDAANRLFPVIEDLQIPVRGLFLLMLLFAVGIGPVNLIVLAKLRRRIWMLWTVPAISLVTCAAVFGYATFAEGWRGHRRTEMLTILDQAAHRATTIGWTAFYSPLTPGGGLRFGYETELRPQLGGLGWGRRGTARTVDWTHDQHLAGGWVSARVPAHFMVRKSQTRRERVVVRRSGAGLVAVNGLGADIRKLYVADGEGKVYLAENIIKGAEVSLAAVPGGGRVQAPTTRSARGMAKAGVMRSAYATNWTGNVDAFIRSPTKYLRPGTYIALLDGTPFIAEGLEGAKSQKCRSVVYGIMSGEPKEKS
ncbi:MAG: hypothetical protein ISS78_01780 [Phycisphaerae bacterium]|nr:hypothetical protein [Phycisphaerae bacterium]